MKKWIFCLAFFAFLLPSCNLEVEVGPERTTFPVVAGAAASVDDGGRVSSGLQVEIMATVSNKYGGFNVQVKYDIKWTDDNGMEHTEQKTTNVRYYKETDKEVFYTAMLPRQKAGRTVYWMVVVTNENGLSVSSIPKHYTVYQV